MSTLKNRVQLIGNLGANPEVKETTNGKKYARLSIATSETYKNNAGEKITDTQWHNLVAWGKTAEIIEKYAKKGSEVAIEGKLTHRSYDDKDGIKRFITEVEISEFVLLGKKEKESAMPF
ncbi:MAG: single-stranded DNA-binding protein [Chitinophagaceae bacterium]|nr:single-stranded DNA-binding protein [Chitinophagaceae bacterium]